MSTTTNAFGFSVIDFSGWLDPAPIYEAIGSAAGVYAATIPVMIFIVFGFRYFAESARNLSGTARFAEAIGDLGYHTIISFAYAAGGFLILKLMLSLSSYFYTYGSFSVIAADFSELIRQLKQTQQDYDASFLETVLDIMSIGSLPVAYGAFLFCSSAFIFVHLLLRLSYAIYFGIIYLWGFIAIPSGALSGAMNLKGGWIKSMMALAIWPIIEATMYLFMKFLMISISAKALDGYSGSNIAAFTAMHSIMAVICLVMLIMSIASAYITMRLVSNQEALSGIVSPAVGVGAYVHSKMTSHALGGMSRMSPSAGGSRGRDKLGDSLASFNQSAPAKLGSGLNKALGGLGNAVSNANKIP
ncbi:MAG: hypothetical protein GY820_43475 [Gammaproteobacteria bacterium]|nr:hypothetical protein [Gammaproteobacteria bacterium]